MIRVLVVDDSRFFRKRLVEIINSDKALTVCGVGCSGGEGFVLCRILKPDVILMDIEMPVLDGISAVRAIIKQDPLPILMYSSKTQQGARSTFEALEAGAVDYIAKDIHDPIGGLEKTRLDLINRIKLLASRKEVGFFEKYLKLGKPRHVFPKEEQSRTQLILIGASTGGPVAVQELILNLPKDFSVPIVVVQHMPGAFTESYAARLNHLSALKVVEGTNGELLEPGKVIIAPGGTHVSFFFQSLHACLKVAPPNHYTPYNPSLDDAFTSAASIFHEHILAIILTGMGDDGMKGVKELKKYNSKVWVQDQESSVIWGMPGKVYHSGYCDEIVNLMDMANRIIQEVGHREN